MTVNSRMLGILARLLLIGCALALARAGARAEEPAAQLAGEPGDTLVQRAIAAYASGDLALARQLFEEAHFNEPTARTLRGLGVVAYREGRFADAVPLLEASLSSQEKALTPELRERAEKLLDECRAKVARLSLAVVPDTAEITRDGSALPRDRDGALVFMPGAVTLRIAAVGHATRELSLDLIASEQRALAIVLPAVAEPPAAPQVPATMTARHVEPLAHGRSGRRMQRWAYGLAAVCGAALVSTAVSAGLGAARVNDANARCRDNADGKCSADEQSQLAADKKLELLAALTNTGIVVAGMSGSASLTLWLLARRAERSDGRAASALNVGINVHF